MATLFQKVRHCFRGLAKFPGLTAVALLSLAIGISANTSIFNTVNRLLLRPLPFYKDANRLVIVEPVAGVASFATVFELVFFFSWFQLDYFPIADTSSRIVRVQGIFTTVPTPA